MCERVDREVFSHGGGGYWCAPVQGEIDGGNPLVRCLEQLKTLSTDKEGKEVRSLAVVGLWVGGAQALWRAASWRR